MRVLALLFSLFCLATPLIAQEEAAPLSDLGLDLRVLNSEEQQEMIDACEIALSYDRKDAGDICAMAIDPTSPRFLYLGFDDVIADATYIECFSIDEEYLYTILFKTYGTYEAFAQNGSLFLYFVRGGTLFEFDLNGNVTSVYSSNDSSIADNNEIIERLSNATIYTVEGKTFERCNDPLALNFLQSNGSSLKVTALDGSSHYLYHASESRSWVLFASLVIAVTIVVIKVANHVKEGQSNEEN